MGKPDNTPTDLPSAASVARFAIFVGLGLTTLVLGFVGLWQYLPSKPDYGRGVLDVLFYDLQLFFVAAEPVNNGGAFPLPLQIARFTGPVVTAYAVVELVAAVFATRRQRLRVHLARRHVVVCGTNRDALLLLERLRASGAKAVLVAPRSDGAIMATCHRTRTPLIVGDASDRTTLNEAGMRKAACVYAFMPDSVLNTAIAVAARSIVSTARHVVTCFAFVDDRELRAALLARGLGDGDDGFHLVLFSVNEIAARTLVNADPLVPDGQRGSSVAVVGLDDFGQTVAVELARRWRIRVELGADRLRIALVGRSAEAVCTQLGKRFTAITSTCDLVPVELGSVDDPAVASRIGDVLPVAPDRVYVCTSDETAAMRIGLSLLRTLRSHLVRIVVRADARGDVLHEAFHGSAGRLFDDALGTLQVFAAQRAACQPAAISEGVSMEDIARALHDTYVADAVARGETVVTQPALRPWEDLPEDLRDANRAHARHLGSKLDVINCVSVPSFDDTAEFAFRTEPDEVELLARMEHDRWVRERLVSGYRYSSAREHLRHPDLVDWSELDDPTREKDRLLVRAIPRILADAGYQIVRLPD